MFGFRAWLHSDAVCLVLILRFRYAEPSDLILKRGALQSQTFRGSALPRDPAGRGSQSFDDHI